MNSSLTHQEVNKPMKNLNSILCPRCSYCGGTRLEEDEDVGSVLIVEWANIRKLGIRDVK